MSDEKKNGVYFLLIMNIVVTTTLLRRSTMIAVKFICWMLFDPVVEEEGEEGNGSNMLGGNWCGKNTLNKAKLTELLVSSLVITWCVPSSGNRYFTEKWPSLPIDIFSNLNNLWPFVTTTLATAPVSEICWPVVVFWTLNLSSVKVSIMGFSGS